MGAAKVADRKHLALLQQLSVWSEKGSFLLNAQEKHEVAHSPLDDIAVGGVLLSSASVFLGCRLSVACWCSDQRFVIRGMSCTLQQWPVASPGMVKDGRRRNLASLV